MYDWMREFFSQAEGRELCEGHDHSTKSQREVSAFLSFRNQS